MTGGGRGFCTPQGGWRGRGVFQRAGYGFGRSGFGARGYPRGRGFGLGPFAYGAGRGVWPVATQDFAEPASPIEEREALHERLTVIEDQLARISERLAAADE